MVAESGSPLMETGSKSSAPCPLPRRIACTSGSRRFRRMVVTGNWGERGFSTLFVRISRFAIASFRALCRAAADCAHTNPSSISALSRNHLSATNSKPGRDSARSRAQIRSATGSGVRKLGGTTVCCGFILEFVPLSLDTSNALPGSKWIRTVSPVSGDQLSAELCFSFFVPGRAASREHASR